MIYGYARCSTNETKQDIRRQFLELKDMGVEESNIFYEYESAMKEDRKELNRLFSVIFEGDTICCTEASRITRSIKQLLSVLEFAKDRSIKLVLGSFVVDFTTSKPDPMTLATVQLMGVFAELERNILSERVKSGMRNAKNKGKQIGRSPTTVEDIPDKFITYYNTLYVPGKINKNELSNLSSLSYPTTLKYISILENNKNM